MADVLRGGRGEDLMAQAAADALDEETILRTILSAVAKTLPPLERAGERSAAMAELARIYIRASVDLHAALALVAPDAARAILEEHA